MDESRTPSGEEAPQPINFQAEDWRHAAQMSPAEKFWSGADLFDYACSITLAGIRAQNPEADEEAVREILDRRLHWWKSRQEKGLYFPVDES